MLTVDLASTHAIPSKRRGEAFRSERTWRGCAILREEKGVPPNAEI